jgi:hypothetical protein
MDPSEVATLHHAIYDIQSGCIITLVSKSKFTLTIQVEDIPLFISEHIFFGSKIASQIQWIVTQHQMKRGQECFVNVICA